MGAIAPIGSVISRHKLGTGERREGHQPGHDCHRGEHELGASG